MAIPFSSLQAQRPRVLPQGGAILGQLTGSFQRGLEAGRARAAEDAAPGLIMDWLDTQAAGYQPQLGSLMPATGYVGGQPSQPDPSMVPGSPTFNGADAMRTARQQADAGIPQPPPVSSGGTGVDAGVRFLDQYEGFSATPYEDWSYRPGTGERYMSGMRIGYGQDATGMPGTVTQEQAQAALRRQIETQYIPSIVNTIGADRWAALNADQQGVLISLVHNYGSLPNRILDEIATGNPQAISQAIAALGSDNNGINRNRRNSEAAAFAGGGGPAAGATAPGTSSAPQQGGWQPPTGQERAALRALIINPATREIGVQLAMQRMVPPTPEPVNYGFTEVGGVLYRTNPQTGQAEAVAGNPNQPQGEDIVTVNGQLVNRRTGEVVGDYRTPPTPDYGFTNVPGVGLVRTNDVAGTAETIMPAPEAGPNFQDEEALRDNFRMETDDYRLISGHYARLQAAAANPSAAGDIAMVYGFMKMLDPASVVRETEYATAQNAAGVPDIVRNLWNRVLSGERLSEAQRADFLGQAGAVYGATQQQYDATVARYRDLATQYQMDPNRVLGIGGVVPPTVAAPAPAATPQASNDFPRLPADPTAAAAAYNALPSGARFYDPEGNLRQKP